MTMLSTTNARMLMQLTQEQFGVLLKWPLNITTRLLMEDGVTVQKAVLVPVSKHMHYYQMPRLIS